MILEAFSRIIACAVKTRRTVQGGLSSVGHTAVCCRQRGGQIWNCGGFWRIGFAAPVVTLIGANLYANVHLATGNVWQE